MLFVDDIVLMRELMVIKALQAKGLRVNRQKAEFVVFNFTRQDIG